MTNPIVASQPQMAQQGIRRLLILSGQADWSRQQAIMLRQHLAGDWLWLSEQPPEGVNSISPTAARTLLGQENLHGVFDATDGLNIEALAIVAGTLRAGSWLLLLVPEWDDWPQRPDKDSLRWSEQPAPIVTANFIRHLQRQFLADPDVVLWQQDRPLILPAVGSRPCW
ncbi:tRNA(Met) cytidine acetyltransferase TmcA, partial [Yersinia pestis PY-64]